MIIKEFENGDDVFVFTINGYSELVLRETRIARENESTVIVEAYGEYKKENVYKSTKNAYDAIIAQFESIRDQIDVPLRVHGIKDACTNE